MSVCKFYSCLAWTTNAYLYLISWHCSMSRLAYNWASRLFSPVSIRKTLAPRLSYPLSLYFDLYHSYVAYILFTLFVLCLFQWFDASIGYTPFFMGVSHSPLSFVFPGFMRVRGMSHCGICRCACRLQGLWEIPLDVWRFVPACAAFLSLVQLRLSLYQPSRACFFSRIPYLATFMTGTVILNARSYIRGAKLTNYGVYKKWKIL